MRCPFCRHRGNCVVDSRMSGDGATIGAAAAELGGKEVPSEFVGGAVMNELHGIDQVAYVRFASVYRSFKDIDEFMRELEDLMRMRKDGAGAPPAPVRDKKGEPVA